jgi:siderophore synthetase component
MNAPEGHARPEPNRDVTDEARNRSIEPLLACVLRELAPPRTIGPRDDLPAAFCARVSSSSTLVEAELPRTGVRIVASVGAPLPMVAAPRALGPVVVRAASRGWVRVDLEGLVALVADELGVDRASRSRARVVAQVLDGERVTRLLLAVGAAKPPTAGGGLIESEQSLLYGHPCHPHPKSRLGFTDEDVLRYSPELRARFPLHYFAVRRDRVVEQSVAASGASEIVAEGLGASATERDFAPLPVHPWQARALLERAEVRAALERGWIRDLGVLGGDFRPTSSVRTVVPARGGGWAYKLALDITITNSVRDNPLGELRAALAVTRALRAVPRAWWEGVPGFRVLEEPAYVSARIDEREAHPGMGVVLRQPVDERVPGGRTLLAASLFGSRELGRERALRLVGRQSVEAWLRAYAGLLVGAALRLYAEQGILVEPHLQNTLLCVDEGGAPRGVVVRDLDNAKLVRASRAAPFADDLPPADGGDLLFEEDEAWTRLTYCLFVNNLGETTAQLARGDAALERRLWGCVRDETVLTLARAGGGARDRAMAHLRSLLTSPTLPAKANLRARFCEAADRAAVYVPVPNPLA